MNSLAKFLDKPKGPVRYVLALKGSMSLKGSAELVKRVKAGEREETVRAEILLREGKAIAG